jgi:nucleotide-binding universal stress UspA family protein
MKLVIGHDGSEQGRDALALGREMADVLGATPVVTTVLPWPSNLMAPDELDAAARADTAELFASASEYLEGYSPEEWWCINRSPADALCQVAEDEAAALIVIGSCHWGPIGKVMLGGVGTSLLHGAPCAVLVAPRGFADDEDRSLRRVGIGFDGSPEAWAALETGIGLAERLRGAITVLTVAEVPRYGYAAALSVFTAEEYESFEHAEKRRLQELAMNRIPDVLDADDRLLSGDAGRVLAEAADELDLLVMGSRGFGPLRRTLLGSASSRLVQSAPCPVLVLPRGAGVDPLAVRSGQNEIPGDSAQATGAMGR